MGMFGYHFYFITNPFQSEVIHRLQLHFTEPLLITQPDPESLEVRNPAYKNNPVWVYWATERTLPFLPETIAIAPEMASFNKLPFPELPHEIGIRAFFDSGPNKLIDSTRQVLQELGGKSEHP
ncbi:hypothetical protein K3G63_16565 [Hymenobacter sp. HSC-4F20]|uniref:hypothetical protein n=1 Tax=Hymenobacter sp. HSC-4F20 TaxID=2864135 RepID=UPI001C737782|nr:hypothetical protein [Hymenobacter sp. HSC-4F20]MBX0292064.1 hypothetical protein [Hymenobacter sp. HSC-4F20]